jgi:HK97 family phage portal protein
VFLSRGSLVTKTPENVWWRGTPGTFTGLELSGFWAAYDAIYRSQLWVYTVVNKRASLLSNLPLKVYERGRDNSREERPDSPLATLLRNPVPGKSALEWWTWITSTEDIYGEAFAWKRRDRGGRPVQLPALHPTCMKRNDADDGWRYEKGEMRLDLPDADVLHFRRYNPSSAHRGLSPLEPLRRTLENEDAARRATSAFWRNGARPAFVLKHSAQLSQPAQDRLKAQFDGLHAGVDNTAASLILEEGMEAQQLSLTAEEAQYIESRKLNREEVVAAYDMAPPAVHILDRATFSNITEQFRSVYRDSVGPRAHGFEQAMMVQLVPDFGDDSLYVEFLMDEVLRGDFETRQTALKNADHMTVAEKRRVENLPYIEGTDVILVNTASMPLDTLTAAPAEVPEPADNVIPMAVARSVAGRLAWQDRLEQIDAKALTEGLNGSTGHVLAALSRARAEGLSVAGFRDQIMAMAKE